ncbi:hypothetical protein AXY20_RS01950 [Acinetobacter baumannii]|nr:hypothetical protein [Acinetobacter baumannii]MDC5112831.1 hypothetical protein [Acinetobacter baumannii]
MLKHSFIDYNKNKRVFEVNPNQKDLLDVIENVYKAQPLKVNKPNTTPAICYRFKNEVEIGLVLNRLSVTIYLNEQTKDSILKKCDSEIKNLLKKVMADPKAMKVMGNVNSFINGEITKKLNATSNNLVFRISKIDHSTAKKLLSYIS